MHSVNSRALFFAAETLFFSERFHLRGRAFVRLGHQCRIQQHRFVTLGRKNALDVGLNRLILGDIAPSFFGQIPAVLKEFVKNLCGFKLRSKFCGNSADDGLEDFVHPLVRNDFQWGLVLPGHCTVGLDVIEHSLCLIFADIHTGQAHELSVMVAGVDDLRGDDYVGTIKIRRHLKFSDLEAQVIETADTLSNTPFLVGFDDFRAREFIPELKVA